MSLSTAGCGSMPAGAAVGADVGSDAGVTPAPPVDSEGEAGSLSPATDLPGNVVGEDN